MKKAFCLLNHELTEKQIQDLHQNWGVENIETTPQTVKNLWKQIPAEKQLEKKYLQVCVDWLGTANDGDVIVLQGEFGSSFALVDYCLSKRLNPIYSVTKRVASEQREGEKVFRHYVFEHVCFRKYEYYKNLE